MNPINISVIMSVYNTKEEYLREAIESILNQTYTHFDFIIINDASTNNTHEVISSYIDTCICYDTQQNISCVYKEKDENRIDRRIRYYSNIQNRGARETLNRALSIASGKYIAFMGHDDISLSHRFQKQVNYLESNSHVSLVGSAIECIPQSQILVFKEEVDLFEVLHGFPLAHPTVMWKREDFERYSLFYDQEYEHCEDYELWSRAIRYVKIHNIQEVLLKYRIHGDNVSIQYKDIQNKNYKRVKENLIQFCTNDKEEQRLLRLLLKKSKRKQTRKWFGFVKDSCYIRFYCFGIRIYKKSVCPM